MTKLKNSNWDETQKHKLWQNPKKLNVTKLKKKSNFDKTQKLKLWQNSKNQISSRTVGKTTWHLDNQWDVLGAAFRDSREVYLSSAALTPF